MEGDEGNGFGDAGERQGEMLRQGEGCGEADSEMLDLKER